MTPTPNMAPTPAPEPVEKALGDFDHPEVIRAGAAVASGQMTPNEAFAALVAVADPTEVSQVMASIKAMDAPRLAQLAESNEAIAIAAQQALQIPDPVARRAFIERQATSLARYGVTPQMISALDYSDAGLAGVVGQAIGLKGLLDKANEERDDARADATLVETRRHNQVIEGKPIETGDGSMIDPSTGRVVYDPYGGGTGAPAGGGDASRVMNYEARGKGFSAVPSSVQTLGQASDFAQQVNRASVASSAMGTYQIVGRTMRGYAPRVFGQNWRNQPFNAETQDRIAEAIFNDHRGSAQALKNQWVSLSLAEAEKVRQMSWAQARQFIANKESGGTSATRSAEAPSGRLRPNSVMTPEQVREYGGGRLPEGVVYRTDGKGNPVPVGGQPKPAAAKKLPPSIAKALIADRSKLGNIDEAIRMIKQNPDSTGLLVGNLPDDVSQRVYPSGVATRAAIARISAIEIHELSGATVTLGEGPRFKPFIPKLTDTAEKIESNLNALRREVISHIREVEKHFSSPVQISGDEDYAKLPSGARFKGPDGVVRTKR